jgi:hypothetical protein
MAVAAVKKRAEEPEQKQKVLVSLDNTNDMVLQMNMDGSIALDWDYLAFRKLPVAVVEKLRPDNMRTYLVAETKAAERAAHTIKVVRNPLSPLTGYSEAREHVRARRGWHQAWANPGRDFDAKMRGPYQQVRQPTEVQKNTGYEPGEESGEILKRFDGENKVEAIAVECPEELYREYLQWVSDQSGVRRTGVKQDFFSAMENINRELPRDARIKPIDDAGELQE